MLLEQDFRNNYLKARERDKQQGRTEGGSWE
jgi:hypothetical protein